MSRKCYVCGKGPMSGNNVSHSNRRTRRKWHPNLQPIRIEEEGLVRRVKICTQCLRTLKSARV